MEKKRYVCLLPTDGCEKGQEVELTDEQFAAANANEPTPRFELIEGQTTQAPAEVVAPVAEAGQAPAETQEAKTEVAPTTEAPAAEQNTAPGGTEASQGATASTEGAGV